MWGDCRGENTASVTIDHIGVSIEDKEYVVLEPGQRRGQVVRCPDGKQQPVCSGWGNGDTVGYRDD